MKSVDELLADNLLQGSMAREFDASRRRVACRHGDWRANFPAIGLLLDSDEERARALAGNYATEMRETIGVWLSAQESGTPGDLGGEAGAAWIEALWSSWRAEVLGGDEFAAFGPAAQQQFSGVFDERMAHFRDQATAFVRQGGAGGAAAGGLLTRLLSPFGALRRGCRRFFFPTLRG